MAEGIGVAGALLLAGIIGAAAVIAAWRGLRIHLYHHRDDDP